MARSLDQCITRPDPMNTHSHVGQYLAHLCIIFTNSTSLCWHYSISLFFAMSAFPLAISCAGSVNDIGDDGLDLDRDIDLDAEFANMQDAPATAVPLSSTSSLSLSSSSSLPLADTVLPPFRLGNPSNLLYRSFCTLLISSFGMAKQKFLQQSAGCGQDYRGTLHDLYEEAMIELATRCHAENQLGYMVAVLVDDAQNSHFLRSHTDGYRPLDSLRLWARLDELWGHQFSSSAAAKKRDSTSAKTKTTSQSSSNSNSAKDSGAVELIRESRKRTLLQCILTEADDDNGDVGDSKKGRSGSSSAAPATAAAAAATAAPPTHHRQSPNGKRPAAAAPSSSYGKAVTNTRRAHFCVNCGAHTEGWPRAWKKFDPLLIVVWCRTCYTPHIISRHALLKHYRVAEEELDRLPSVYAHSRASTSMLCYLFDQAFANKSLVVRLRNARPRLARPPAATAKTASKRPSDDADADTDADSAASVVANDPLSVSDRAHLSAKKRQKQQETHSSATIATTSLPADAVLAV